MNSTATTQSPGTQRGSVLVVDDDPMLLRMTQIVLVDAGYGVTTASSGANALNEIEKVQGGFGLVVLDMRMPDMDGMEVLERVRERWPALKVMLVTGFVPDNVVDELMQLGAVGVLEKPYDPDTLARAVGNLIGG